MAEPPSDRQTPEYEETTDPRNPPNILVRPDVRTAAFWIYLGPIVAIVVVLGVALLYWSQAGPAPNEDVTRTIGTVGDEPTPGGFDPDRRPDDTRDELEYRGFAPLTTLGGLVEPRTAIGKEVDLKNVRVDEPRDATSFVIEDANVEMVVVAPSQAPAVRHEMRVDVKGVIESDGKGGARIRATSVTPR